MDVDDVDAEKLLGGEALAAVVAQLWHRVGLDKRDLLPDGLKFRLSNFLALKLELVKIRFSVKSFLHCSLLY